MASLFDRVAAWEPSSQAGWPSANASKERAEACARILDVYNHKSYALAVLARDKRQRKLMGQDWPVK